MDPQSGAGQPDILIGQTVGNYLVTQKLGEGGMGSVYMAEHPTIGKRVALKVLHSEFCQNEDVARRFMAEAKAVNDINHPNIVDIIDYGVLHTGAGGRDILVYFIMEYLQGQSLSQIVRVEAPLTPERALTIALQVADALAASHKCGIVHRDLKPDNIMVSQRGRETDFVKLLDFGIAKLTGGSGGLSSHRTRTGLVLGTPAYMSPEQCEGRPNVDHRTDIYALGICLYEMLTGRVPFIGEGYGEILVQHLTQRPIEPSRYRMMSPHVEQVVLKALEKRPEMRYPTMDEFMRAMADPVGYVEAHGGIAGFLSRQLMPSTGPVPPVRLTPGPMSMAIATPSPGRMTPLPGTLSPVPTTLSSATGHQMHAPGASKRGFVIAGVAVAALAAVAVTLVIVTKKNDAAQNGSGSGSVVAMGTGSGSGSAPVVVPSTGSGSAGSATVQPQHVETGSGSAATGSGSAGSAAVVIPEPPAMVKLKISSKPEGAEIYLDGIDTGKQTTAVLDVPRKNKSVNITLKLSSYKDVLLKNIALDHDEVAKNVALDKVGQIVRVPAGSGSGTGSGGGKGSASKGSGHKDDTGLMRPEDL